MWDYAMYAVGNISFEKDRVTKAHQPVSLTSDRTGCPIFLLPFPGITQTKCFEVTSKRSWVRSAEASLSAIEKASREVIDLFFDSGGQLAKVLLLPLRQQLEVPSDDELWEAANGFDRGFRRRSGFESIFEHETSADLVLAPTLSMFASNETLRRLNQYLLHIVDQTQHMFAILDAPMNVQHEDTQRLTESFSSSRGALYAGNFRSLARRTMLPISPFAAATYERNDRERSIEYTPANLAVQLPEYELISYSQDEFCQLEEHRVNFVVSFVESEMRLWGSRTLSHTDDYTKYIACSRFMLAFRNTMEDLLAPFVFSVATESQRKLAETTVSAFIDQYYDPARKGRALDLGPKPKFSLTIETNDSREKSFHVDVNVYLTIPMTWVELKMSYEG